MEADCVQVILSLKHNIREKYIIYIPKLIKHAACKLNAYKHCVKASVITYETVDEKGKCEKEPILGKRIFELSYVLC